MGYPVRYNNKPSMIFTLDFRLILNSFNSLASYKDKEQLLRVFILNFSLVSWCFYLCCIWGMCNSPLRRQLAAILSHFEHNDIFFQNLKMFLWSPGNNFWGWSSRDVEKTHFQSCVPIERWFHKEFCRLSMLLTL